MSTSYYPPRPVLHNGDVPPPPTWQHAVKTAIRDPLVLCRALGLPAEFEAGAVAAAGSFPVFVPRGYLARMKPGDPDDPLLRQVLPRLEETTPRPGDLADPVGDAAAALSPGLLHKYEGRALMVTTGACAVHCRYCFRRQFPYAETPHSVAEWGPGIAQIAQDSSLHEVILSGGDPLMLVDDVLAELVERLAAIPHLRRLRVHTRLPIMIPERVTPALPRLLRGTRLTPIVVVHANHPVELAELQSLRLPLGEGRGEGLPCANNDSTLARSASERETNGRATRPPLPLGEGRGEGASHAAPTSVADALAELIDAGIPVLNQAVLLRGVNDSADVLAELCERLIDLRVLPYYLHQLDRVTGAAHFEVPPAAGRAILSELRRRLPGYAVPRYVQELPGAEYKLSLG